MGTIAQFVELVLSNINSDYFNANFLLHFFTPTLEYGKKRQPKALVVTECKLCKAVALSEGNVFIDPACPKFEWCPNTSAQESCFGECPLN